MQSKQKYRVCCTVAYDQLVSVKICAMFCHLNRFVLLVKMLLCSDVQECTDISSLFNMFCQSSSKAEMN